jgi:hypothetical protein
MNRFCRTKSEGIRGILQRTQQPRAHLKQPEDLEFPREQEQQVGPEETSQENPCGDLDGRMIAQMELQTNTFLKAITALTANQGAAAAVEADGTKNTGVVPDHTGALLRKVQGWEEHSAERVPDGAQSKTNQKRVGAQYVVAFCQVLPEGRGCFMVGRLHLVIRG